MADVVRDLVVKLGIDFDNASAQRAERKVEQLKYAAEGLAAAFGKGGRLGNVGKVLGGDFLGKKALGVADVNPASLGKFQGSNDPFAVMGKSLDYVEPKAKSFLEKLTSIRAALIGMGAAIAVKKLSDFVQHTADAADELKAQAERIGTSTQALQGLQFAAQMSDTSAEALGSGLQFLARSAFAAANGSKEAQEAFTKLGISSLKDANGNLKTSDQLMLEVADGLQKIESPAEKTALVMKVMGRSAGELVPMLSKGSAEILAFRQELEDLGGSFSSEFVDLADDWNDDLTRIGAVFNGIGAAIAKGVLPPLRSMISRFMIFWRASGAGVRAGLEKFFAGIGNALNIIGQLVESVLFPMIDGWGKLLWVLGEVDSGLLIIGGTIAVVAAAFLGLISPWLVLGGLIALIAEDIYTYFVGGESVTGRVVETFHGMALELQEAFGAAIDWVVAKFDWLGDKLRGGLQAVAGWFGGGDIMQTITAQNEGVTPSAAAGGTVVNAPTTTNTFQINASPGMDENALADKVAQKISEHEDARNQEAFGALVPAVR